MTIDTLKTQDDADELAAAAATLRKHGLEGIYTARGYVHDVEHAADVISKHGLVSTDSAAREAANFDFKPAPQYENGTLARVTTQYSETYLMYRVGGGWALRASGALPVVADDSVEAVEPLVLADPDKVQIPRQLAINAAITLTAAAAPAAATAIRRAIAEHDEAHGE